MVGPGALGCLLAARLHLAGAGPALLDHDPARAALLNRQGIILAEAGGVNPAAVVPVSTDPATVGGADLVLLCVKAPALNSALDAIAPLLPPSSLLLALQNGISHLEILSARKLPCAWALGVSTEGANLQGPGRVRSGGAGLTELGFVQPPTPAADQLLNATVALLNRAGLRAARHPEIIGRLWRKLIINCGINALTVIHDCPNGRLLEIPAARRAMAAAVREAAAVAAASGINLPDDPVALTEAICRQTATNISSMLQDIRQGRATEIMAINGEIVRRAGQLGLATPVNLELLTAAQLHHRSPTR
ncbi:ketopantoate reductase family protein [Desulfurivibrio sp. D14AmB]|uniref:ketopantoate reductase family protein n=1 Tax=Desulfurivibrio sp. D14AmB TaxID=3374370 RepID=UPI00376EA236